MSGNIDLSKQNTRYLKLSQNKRLSPEGKTVLARIATWFEPVFEYEIEECAYGSLERTDSFIYGCPWESDPDERPVYSLCQIDLDSIEKLTGKKFGGGLLQFSGFSSEDEDTEDELYCFDYDTPLIADWRIISRSAINDFGDPVPFNKNGLSPLEFFRSDGWSFIFENMKSIDPYIANSEYDLMRAVDPKRAAEIKREFDNEVAEILCSRAILGDSEGFEPAKRIVNWKNVSNHYYRDLADLSDNEILEACQEEYPMNCFPTGSAKGLFVWPWRFEDYWPGDAKPFFTMTGWDGRFNMANEWEILYRNSVVSQNQSPHLDYRAFGYRRY